MEVTSPFSSSQLSLYSTSSLPKVIIWILSFFSSLKTEDNLKVVKNIPLEHLMLETDAPWCDIRNSHASSKLTTTNYSESYKVANKPNKWEMGGLVKGRNEPIFIQ